MNEHEKVTVIPPGTEVTLWGGVGARVDSVILEMGNRVCYRVVYWDSGGSLQYGTVAAELVAVGEGTLPIGFSGRTS